MGYVLADRPQAATVNLFTGRPRGERSSPSGPRVLEPASAFGNNCTRQRCQSAGHNRVMVRCGLPSQPAAQHFSLARQWGDIGKRLWRAADADWCLDRTAGPGQRPLSGRPFRIPGQRRSVHATLHVIKHSGVSRGQEWLVSISASGGIVHPSARFPRRRA
jgi:hypothetical protein